MPAKKDFTAWKPVKGDHADDQTYERIHGNPTKPPTDEARTAAETKDKS
jgi:hypothetical protein